MGNLADRVGPKKRFVREASSLQQHLLSDSGDVSVESTLKNRLLLLTDFCVRTARAELKVAFSRVIDNRGKLFYLLKKKIFWLFFPHGS